MAISKVTQRWERREWLLQPRRWAVGPARAALLAMQTELLEELEAVDAAVEHLVARRTAIVDELHRCRDGLGTGSRWLPRPPLPSEISAVPNGTRPVGGAALRDTLVTLLRSVERPLTLTELYRSLLACGLHVEGRPSHALSNALRAAVANGDVRRIRPGVYAAPD